MVATMHVTCNLLNLNAILKNNPDEIAEALLQVLHSRQGRRKDKSNTNNCVKAVSKQCVICVKVMCDLMKLLPKAQTSLGRKL